MEEDCTGSQSPQLTAVIEVEEDKKQQKKNHKDRS
jgi:hypothetical protein